MYLTSLSGQSLKPWSEPDGSSARILPRGVGSQPKEGVRAMSTTTHATRIPLVVVYDVMRESANRLAGRIMAIADVEGSDQAVAGALDQVREIRSRVDAVDVYDRDAIQRMDAELREAFSELPNP